MFKTYFDDSDFTMKLENAEGQVFVHLDVRRWAPSVAKKLLVVQQHMEKEVKRAGYKVLFAVNRNEDAKWYKFVESFGYRPLTEHDGRTVYFRELASGN